MKDEQSSVKREIEGLNELGIRLSNLLSTESWWKEESNETKMTRRDRKVVDFTRYHVKNYSELTNLGN